MMFHTKDYIQRVRSMSKAGGGDAGESARFGHEDRVLELMTWCWRQIAPQIGWTADQIRITSGCLGSAECRSASTGRANGPAGS